MNRLFKAQIKGLLTKDYIRKILENIRHRQFHMFFVGTEGLGKSAISIKIENKYKNE